MSKLCKSIVIAVSPTEINSLNWSRALIVIEKSVAGRLAAGAKIWNLFKKGWAIISIGKEVPLTVPASLFTVIIILPASIGVILKVTED